MPLPYDQQPLRVVVGETKIPNYFRVFDRVAPTLMIQSRDPEVVLQKLVDNDIRHIWLEGGPRLAGAFWNAGVIDRIIGYMAPAMLGSGRAALEGEATTLADLRPIHIDGPPDGRPGHPHHRHPRTHAARGLRLMFTGLVEEKGTITAVEDLGDSVRLTIRGPVVTSDAKPRRLDRRQRLLPDRHDAGRRHVRRRRHEGVAGQDVARRPDQSATRSTSNARCRRAPGLGGHIVQGHVDGTGRILDRTPSEHWEVVRIALPAELARYLVNKGSITVDGTSLTVVEVVDAPEPWFSVSLIPTTLADTTLGTKAPGDRVNLEVDILAKYVERLLAAKTSIAKKVDSA